jgi:uncharacterized protein YmfQ (DUF2313 family)
VYRHRDTLKLLFPLELGGDHLTDLDLEGTWLDRVRDRAEILLLEMIPGSCNETLADWERVLGLPDPCTGPLPTVQLRRQAAAAKDAAGGGLSRAYFIDLALSLGAIITITEGVAGDPYTWQINAGEVPIRYFLSGTSTSGNRLREWGSELLECAFLRMKPAHTHVIFGYGS